MTHPTLATSPASPFVKWVGGKAKVLKEYLRLGLIPDFETYYEPFLGGGAMFYHLNPTYALLSDINADLITTYQAVKEDPELVIEFLEILDAEHSPEQYEIVRRSPVDPRFRELSKFTIAARFIYLNKACYNGVYRVNKRGEFNVPMGQKTDKQGNIIKPTICDHAAIMNASEALKYANIKHGNYAECVGYAIANNAFVFFDPPYVPVSKTANFTAYDKGGFTLSDQKLLKAYFVLLSGLGAKVMLANSDCEFIRNLYKDFNVHTVQASRAVNSDPSKRGKINEVVITNY